jgi:hypothetical protein
MEILVTYVSVGRQGRAQRDQRRIAGAVLDVGRGTHCKIHLADARVALNHARITVTAQGATIEAQSGTVEVNGRVATTAALAVGDRIEIGPYDIEVEAPPAGFPLALSVKLTRQPAARGISLRRALARRPSVSKRRLSYIAFLSVLLLCLLVPMGSDLLEEWHLARAVPQPQQETELPQDVLHALSGKFTLAWNPGPVSRSHQIFGSDCRACHEYPFVQVRDGACLACHKEIREHVARTQLTGERGPSFAEARCAECHRDHKGIQMAPRAQEQCADCHRDVKAFATKAGSDNVTDFRVDHPPFRLSMLDADAPGVVRRVRQGGGGSLGGENSNLKFNHALHLDPRGVRSPEGKHAVLECASCHKPADGGRLMAPVTMEKHCQECHSLAFEPKLTQRQVPHGPEEAVATMLREFYARLVLGDAPPGVTAPPDMQRRRPGAVLSYDDRQQALRVADERAQRALRDLFETREVCTTCHDVSRTDGGWRVAPVAVTSHWMPQSRFTHAKHTAQSCTTCHDVTKSKESRDVGMPKIAKCRECHVGARAVVDKVTSDCTTCHQFHAGRDRWHGPASLISQREAKSRKTPMPK